MSFVGGGLILLYLLIVAFLPLYNAVLLEPFPFPFTSSWIQTSVVAILLLAAFILYEWYRIDSPLMTLMSDWQDKLLFLFIPGVSLGLTIGFIFLSIAHTNININVMLRSSEIVWVVILARIFLKERISIQVGIISFILVIGVILLSWDPADGTSGQHSPWILGVLYSLIAAIANAIHIVSIRVATDRLGRNRANWRMEHKMSIVETTVWTTMIASITLFPLAMSLEGSSAWASLRISPHYVRWLLILGIVITCAFQIVHIGVVTYCLAITVSFVNLLQVFPQVFVNVVVGGSPLYHDATHIIAYILVPLCGLLFAVEQYRTKYND